MTNHKAEIPMKISSSLIIPFIRFFSNAKIMETALNTSLFAEAVCDLYRARWQIELVFKACKSYLKIDKLGDSEPYQLECLIYGILIAICIAFFDV